MIVKLFKTSYTTVYPMKWAWFNLVDLNSKKIHEKRVFIGVLSVNHLPRSFFQSSDRPL